MVSAESDVRTDPAIGLEILNFIESQGVKSVIMADRIIGCPHEEGTDYPDGQSCPHCPFGLIETGRRAMCCTKN